MRVKALVLPGSVVMVPRDLSLCPRNSGEFLSVIILCHLIVAIKRAPRLQESFGCCGYWFHDPQGEKSAVFRSQMVPLPLPMTLCLSLFYRSCNCEDEHMQPDTSAVISRMLYFLYGHIIHRVQQQCQNIIVAFVRQTRCRRSILSTFSNKRAQM